MTIQAGSAPPPGSHGRLRSLAPIVIFDIAWPLAAYYGLRAAGMPNVGALIVSGVLPAPGILLGAVRNRRLDVIGVLILLGILAGTVLGLVSGSAHLVLPDGTVPTALFGLLCLGWIPPRLPGEARAPPGRARGASGPRPGRSAPAMPT